jgi:endoglucanase
MNSSAFNNVFNAEGKPGANEFPDILDEAKWGLDWLLKMYPSKNILYHQIADDSEQNSSHLPLENNTDYGREQGNGRPAYLATGKPQGLFTIKNHTTGIASIAGKYSSAFALGAEIFSKFNPTFADSLKQKALESYELGKKYSGVCQSIPAKSKQLYEEDNWADDMELAAAQLYRITYEANYLKEAAAYGRMEPITPWLCSDTANHYQWYPFINLGHFMLANVENPRYQKEYILNMQNGLQRMQTYANNNPFNISIPFIRCSNNLITALASQCQLYRSLSNDTTFIDMETALTDWLFGRNPWGTSMITRLPKIGDSPMSPYSPLLKSKHIQISGGLVNGPVQRTTYKSLKNNQLSNNDPYERFQSDWAVYHDDPNDYSTNEPTMDGTASLTFLLSNKQKDGVQEKTADKNEYTCGGITRTDISKKQISLVFSGHENAEGYKTIHKVLKKLNIKASFFFTGDFYRKGKFKSIIKGLQKENHYLGAHSDKNLLYCSWIKKDSLLVTKSHFLSDLKANYEEMQKFGISKNQAPFFLPANEWYNDSISLWSKEVGLQLINYTPGTLSYTDESTPEMRERYFSSNEIFNKIRQVETSQTLNGHILLFHLGSDRRRQDKFYPRLYALLIELSKDGYNFVDLFQATDIIGKNEQFRDKKQKRKN